MKAFLLHALFHKSYIVNNKGRSYAQFASKKDWSALGTRPYLMKPFLLDGVSHKTYIVSNKEKSYTQFASTKIVPH